MDSTPSSRGRRQASLALVIVIVTSGLLCDVASETYEDVKNEKMNLVKQVATELRRRFDNVKSTIEGQQCQCSYHFCGHTFSDTMQCMRTGTTENVTCDKSNGRGLCKHMRIDVDHTVVRTPGEIINDQLHQHPSVVTDICFTQGLEDTFKDANNFSGEFVPWTYFASVRSGVMSIWPAKVRCRGEECGSPRGCEPYDPRIRPWYKVSTSEPKNVIIVIEASMAMENQNIREHPLDPKKAKSRWEHSKTAINDFLDTLPSFDFVNIVAFNKEATVLNETKQLLEATEENLDSLRKALDNIKPTVGFNVSVAFSQAFDLFQNALSSRSFPRKNCQNIILYISTSEPEGGDGLQNALYQVETMQKKINDVGSLAAIFTLTMEGDNARFARQLSCRHGGVWSFLDGVNSPLNRLDAYFQYIGFSIEPSSELTDREEGFTSRIYVDASGLGEMNTFVYPVFVKPQCANGNTSSNKLLLGVVGKDVIIKEYLDRGLTRAKVDSATAAAVNHVVTCSGSYSYDSCKMQILRGKQRECLIDFWDQNTTCHRFKQKYYQLIHDPKYHANFSSAMEYCQNKSGHLVEFSSADEQHFLATIVPPDGAWIGMNITMTNEWIWVHSQQSVDVSKQALWLKEPNKASKCVGGVIDPRGPHTNIWGANCWEKKAFVCQFDELPSACASQKPEKWSPDNLLTTAKACLQADNCNELVDVKPPKELAQNVVCQDKQEDIGKNYSTLVCCQPEKMEEKCEPTTSSSGSSNALVLSTSIVAAVSIVAVIAIAIRQYFHKNHVSPMWQPPNNVSLTPGLDENNRIPFVVLEENRDTGMAELEILSPKKILDEGRSATVQKARYNDRDVVMKVFRDASIKNEVDIITKIGTHPNIVRFYGINTGHMDDHGFIVMELVPDNLAKWLRNDLKMMKLTYNQLMHIGLDILNGLLHLHSKEITHGDVSPGNILLKKVCNDGNCTAGFVSKSDTVLGQSAQVRIIAVLTDFNHSVQRKRNRITQHFVGTPGYMPPETMIHIEGAKVQGEFLDIYSFAAIMWECITGRQVTRSDSFTVSTCGIDGIFPRELMDLIVDCLSIKATDRPTCRTVRDRFVDWTSSVDPEWVNNTLERRLCDLLGHGCVERYKENVEMTYSDLLWIFEDVVSALKKLDQSHYPSRLQVVVARGGNSFDARLCPVAEVTDEQTQAALVKQPGELLLKNGRYDLGEFMSSCVAGPFNAVEIPDELGSLILKCSEEPLALCYEEILSEMDHIQRLEREWLSKPLVLSHQDIESYG